MQIKSTKSFLLGVLISASVTPSIEAHVITDWLQNNKTFVAIAAIIGPSAWDYFQKREVLERYDLEELKTGKNLFSNVAYLYLDGFWGTPPKNESIKLKSDNGDFVYEPSKKRDGTGIIGTIHTNSKNIFTITGLLVTLHAIMNRKAYTDIIELIVQYIMDAKKTALGEAFKKAAANTTAASK